MKILIELAKQTKQNRKLIEAILPSTEESKLILLYNTILNNDMVTEHEAMLSVYKKPNHVAFSRLKTRLRELLTKTLVFQNLNAQIFDQSVDETITCYRNTFAARILLEKRASKSAIELLEKTIITSIRYHLTENVLSQSRLLVSYYGSTEYNKYKYSKYFAIQQEYIDIYKWEILSENYYFDLQRIQLRSLASISDEMLDKAQEYSDTLLKAPKVNSFYFNYNKYRVLAALYEYQKDYNSLLSLCNKTITEFNSYPFKRKHAISSLRIRQLWALIQSGQYDDCIYLGLKSMKNEIEGSNYWYFFGHYTLKSQLYNKDYNAAALLINELMTNKRYESISDNLKEIFSTTLGYIHLISQSKLIDNRNEIAKIIPEFKIGKFLNTVPVFSKDKQGINVSILLMHIAYLLQRKDYGTIIDRIDSLKQYAYRYLRKDDSFRSNCMIKMVAQMARADFNPIRTERYTLEFRRQLSEVKLAGSGENIEIEFIPFEDLWEIMIKTLE